MTAIATLVERHSRYVVLCKLPNGHGAEAVRIAPAKRILTLPANLRHSLPWDQGKTRALQRGHRSPGLLPRPKEPLATRHQREHERPVAPIPPQGRRPVLVLTAAAQRHCTVNGRPRQTLGWMPPSQAFAVALR